MYSCVINFRFSLSVSTKKIPTGVLIVTMLNLQINFRKTDILMVFPLLILIHKINIFIFKLYIIVLVLPNIKINIFLNLLRFYDLIRI